MNSSLHKQPSPGFGDTRVSKIHPRCHNSRQANRRMSLTQVAPFEIELLRTNQTDTATDGSIGLLELLPASYRERRFDITPASLHVEACIAQELNLDRLTNIRQWLWIAGLPMPPRSLHHQLLLSREIFITQQLDMHLVWTTGRIFIKPLPRFLLDPKFWKEYLVCGEGCGCAGYESAQSNIASPKNSGCPQRKLYRTALGFLYSYVALLPHESDILLAQDRYLVPREVQWPKWREFVEQLLSEPIHRKIDPRFVHGELRLSRLNKIYILYQTPLSGYMSQWNQYGSFFSDNFGWLAGAIVYIAIVLTAMQVGLATKPLADNDAFQAASYGFTVFALLGPLIAATIIVLQFLVLFVINWSKAAHWKRSRYDDLLSAPIA